MCTRLVQVQTSAAERFWVLLLNSWKFGIFLMSFLNWNKVQAAGHWMQHVMVFVGGCWHPRTGRCTWSQGLVHTTSYWITHIDLFIFVLSFFFLFFFFFWFPLKGWTSFSFKFWTSQSPFHAPRVSSFVSMYYLTFYFLFCLYLLNDIHLYKYYMHLFMICLVVFFFIHLSVNSCIFGLTFID